MSTQKTKIIAVDTACDLLGCTRSNIYTFYLKKKLLTPVPRVGKKAYLYHDQVSQILDKKLADLAARKNLRLTEADLNQHQLLPQSFKDQYIELTSKY